MILTDSA